ncbi:hypothetical protein HNP55_000333 [Paucibacter oligotrophus]|uniref:Peptidoglycan binding protein n=1 Tax=Roseateles oligotrophus TaxID=1769250 RepID=A0A840L6J5_9BURK|nr:hypothetical protein [Roseateles oligotrophus]MBB4841838.1 hypothetical protein [Roseateles oligotrophus]
MDTRMLDVVIGLVLVFALTSLLVTAWQEALASLKNSRGENLQKAVTSLLGDDAAFAGRLMSHPLLLSLAMERPGKTQRSPSYISPDVFVNALLAQLTSDYTGGLRPATPADLVAHLQQKLPPGQQKFGASLAALLPGAEQDWSAYETRLAAWFNAVGERSIGWFKRGTQAQMFAAGLVVAAAVNINPILITQALWSDAALRKSVAAQAELAVQAYQKETGLGEAKPAPTDKAAPVLQLASSRQATLDLIEALLKPANAQGLPAATEADDLLRSSYKMKELLNPERPASLAELQHQVDKLGAQLKGSGLDQHAATAALVKTLQGRIQALSPADAAASAVLASACSPKLSAEDHHLCAQDELKKKLEGLGLPLGWAQAGLPTVWATHCNGGLPAGTFKAPDCTPGEKMAEAAWWGNLLLALAGWLGTAMAVTLGAPFWFDLLGRLVKIRGAGGKPDEAGSTGAAAPSTLSKSEAPPAVGAGGPTQEASDDALNDDERKLTPIQIGTLQKRLRMAASDISLRLDIKTRDAIKAWQTQAFGQGDGLLNAQQIQQLLSADFDPQDDGYLG